MKNSEKQKGKIYWSVKLVSNVCSNNSSSDISQAFISMFVESEIDKSLEVDPDKLKDVVIFWKAHYFKDIPRQLLKKSDYNVTSPGKSFSDITEK